MTLQKAIEILENHQRWRKGEDAVQTEPKELSEALEVVLKTMRTINELIIKRANK